MVKHDMVYRTFFALIFFFVMAEGCQHQAAHEQPDQPVSEEALLDSVQHATFQYFWDGAEPTSGMVRSVIMWTVNTHRTIKT